MEEPQDTDQQNRLQDLLLENQNASLSSESANITKLIHDGLTNRSETKEYKMSDNLQPQTENELSFVDIPTELNDLLSPVKDVSTLSSEMMSTDKPEDKENNSNSINSFLSMTDDGLTHIVDPEYFFQHDTPTHEEMFSDSDQSTTLIDNDHSITCDKEADSLLDDTQIIQKSSILEIKHQGFLNEEKMFGCEKNVNEWEKNSEYHLNNYTKTKYIKNDEGNIRFNEDNDISECGRVGINSIRENDTDLHNCESRNINILNSNKKQTKEAQIPNETILSSTENKSDNTELNKLIHVNDSLPNCIPTYAMIKENKLPLYTHQTENFHFSIPKDKECLDNEIFCIQNAENTSVVVNTSTSIVFPCSEAKTNTSSLELDENVINSDKGHFSSRVYDNIFSMFEPVHCETENKQLDALENQKEKSSNRNTITVKVFNENGKLVDISDIKIKDKIEEETSPMITHEKHAQLYEYKTSYNWENEKTISSNISSDQSVIDREDMIPIRQINNDFLVEGEEIESYFTEDVALESALKYALEHVDFTSKCALSTIMEENSDVLDSDENSLIETHQQSHAKEIIRDQNRETKSSLTINTNIFEEDIPRIEFPKNYFIMMVIVFILANYFLHAHFPIKMEKEPCLSIAPHLDISHRYSTNTCIKNWKLNLQMATWENNYDSYFIIMFHTEPRVQLNKINLYFERSWELIAQIDHHYGLTVGRNPLGNAINTTLSKIPAIYFSKDSINETNLALIASASDSWGNIDEMRVKLWCKNVKLKRHSCKNVWVSWLITILTYFFVKHLLKQI